MKEQDFCPTVFLSIRTPLMNLILPPGDATRVIRSIPTTGAAGEEHSPKEVTGKSLSNGIQIYRTILGSWEERIQGLQVS